MRKITILVVAVAVLAIVACSFGQVTPAGVYEGEIGRAVVSDNYVEIENLLAGNLSADGATFTVTKVWAEDAWQDVAEEYPAEPVSFDGETLTIGEGDQQIVLTLQE